MALATKAAPSRRGWGVAVFTATTLWCQHVLSAPPAVTVPDSDRTIVYSEVSRFGELSPVSSDNPQYPGPDTSISQRLDEVQQRLEHYAVSGNLRLLGDAQRVLNSLEARVEANPDSRGRFYLYRARLLQSLHRFDEAAADLSRALQEDNTRQAALLVAFNVAFVQGNYRLAATHCEQIQATLYAASCRAHLDATTGDPVRALAQMKEALGNGLLGADPQAQQWAVSTAADIAERANDYAQAETFWRLALRQNSGDSYARARLCDNLVEQGKAGAAIAMTEGTSQRDDVAVCRARALLLDESSELPPALRSALAKRFEEARWRGEVLHKRALGNYLLHIEGQAKAALAIAKQNWQEQKEWPDQLLLQAAEKAAGGPAT